MVKTMLTSCLLLVAVCIGQGSAQTGDNVKDLLTDLFETKSYNKLVRPVANQADVLDVNVDFFLTTIIDFDEQNELLKTSGFLRFEWVDEFLLWDPALFGGLDVLFLPQDNIWRPDVSLRNTYEQPKDTGIGSRYLNVQIDYTGTVHWSPLQIFKSTCDIDITYYPFDVQECQLKFTAWSYRKSEVTMTLGTTGIQLDNYDADPVWDLVGTSTKAITTEETAVIFLLKMKRKPSFFLITLISPIVLLTLLNIFTFILPVSYGERASYAITVFLSLVVFLTIFAAELPKNSDTVSILAIYLMLMSCFSTLVVLVSLFQTRLTEKQKLRPPDPINFFYRGIYRISQIIKCRVCFKRNRNVTPSKVDLRENNETDVSDEVTWKNVVDAIDFFFFWFSLLFTFISTTALTGIAYAQSTGYSVLEVEQKYRFDYYGQ